MALTGRFTVVVPEYQACPRTDAYTPARTSADRPTPADTTAVSFGSPYTPSSLNREANFSYSASVTLRAL